MKVSQLEYKRVTIEEIREKSKTIIETIKTAGAPAPAVFADKSKWGFVVSGYSFFISDLIGNS